MQSLLKIILSLVLVLCLPVQVIATAARDSCCHQTTGSVPTLADLKHQGEDCCSDAEIDRMHSCDHCAGCCLAVKGGVVYRAALAIPAYLSIPVSLTESGSVRSYCGDPLFKPPRIF